MDAWTWRFGGLRGIDFLHSLLDCHCLGEGEGWLCLCETFRHDVYVSG